MKKSFENLTSEYEADIQQLHAKILWKIFESDLTGEQFEVLQELHNLLSIATFILRDVPSPCEPMIFEKRKFLNGT